MTALTVWLSCRNRKIKFVQPTLKLSPNLLSHVVLMYICGRRISHRTKLSFKAIARVCDDNKKALYACAGVLNC